MDAVWAEAQIWEKNWWIRARDQHAAEITKNNFVSKMMFLHDGVPDKTVIDIGCGPLSLLLRLPVKQGTALDPLYFDDLEAAYEKKGITRLVKCGEDLNSSDGHFDEAWIYNCLQHVKNPTKIIENAIAVSDTVRIFEWTYIKPYTGHLHELTPESLSAPFSRAGWHKLMSTTGYLSHSGLNGNYFMAIYTRRKRESL
jgi:hypothetical protein